MLVQDDLLKKLFNIYDMMSLNEHPRSNNNIQIKYLQLETKIATITDDDRFTVNIVPLNMAYYFCYL